MKNPESSDPTTIGVAPSAPSLAAVRVQSLTETGTAREFQLSLLWQGICSGSYRILDQFCSADRHYIVAERIPTQLPQKSLLRRRRLDVLHRVLGGSSQKAISIELRVSPATVASDLQKALASIGCASRGVRALLILAMAAQASANPSRNFGARYTALNAGTQLLHVVSAERPELELERLLTRTELDVVQMLLRGSSQREIAAARRTSVRTVANQLASAYGRLGLSGRVELIHHIVTAPPPGAAGGDSRAPA